MKLAPVIASRFRSDGGTMFGPVPRGIWEKCVSPDERNTIPQNANALLVTLADGRHGLVEAGCGPRDKYPEKEATRAGLGPGWPLAEELAARGLAAEDIEFILLTHLHWDHLGGAIDAAGSLAFPHATIHVDLHEMVDAESGSPLYGAAYPPDLVRALANCGSLRRVLHRGEPAYTSLWEGIRLVRSGGHTAHHCVVLFEPEALEIDYPHAPIRRVVFLGDMVPTRHHLRTLYHTGYDTFPMQTRAWKHTWLPQFVRDDTLVLFGHDPEVYGGRLEAGEKGPVLRDAWEIPA